MGPHRSVKVGLFSQRMFEAFVWLYKCSCACFCKCSSQCGFKCLHCTQTQMYVFVHSGLVHPCACVCVCALSQAWMQSEAPTVDASFNRLPAGPPPAGSRWQTASPFEFIKTQIWKVTDPISPTGAALEPALYFDASV